MQKQIIDIKQDFRVLSADGKQIHQCELLSEALEQAVIADGDCDVQQAIEFSVFGKKPEVRWVSVFDMEMTS